MKRILPFTFNMLSIHQQQKVCLLSFFILLLVAGVSNAAIVTTTGSGNWSSTTPNAPWPGGTIPAVGDDIVIGTGFTLTVDGNRTCNSLTVGNGSIISVNATIILTVTTTLTFPNLAAANRTGTVTGSGTLNTNAVQIGGPTVPTGSATVTVTSSITALNVAGNLTVTSLRSGGFNSNPTVQLQSGRVTVNGTLACVTAANAASTTLVTLATGAQTGYLVLANATATSTSGNTGVSTFTFNGTGSTVEYSGAAQTALPTTYTNLTVSGTLAKTFANTPTVNGILSMEGTTASITVTGVAVVTYGAGATLQYNKTAAFVASVEEWISPFIATGGIIIKNTGAITSPGAVQIGNNTSVPLNINTGGTLTPAANLITLHGDFINDGTLTSGTGGVTIAGTTATQSIDGFTTTGTVSMTKTGGTTATLQGNVNGAILTINGTGGTLNLGAGLTHTFTGNWNRTNGTLNGGSSTLKIGGNVAGATGTFTSGTGTVEWNAAGAQTAAGVAYNNLTLSGSGAKTITGVTVNGILSMEGTATASVAPTYGGSATLQYNTTTARNTGVEWITPFLATGGVIIKSTGAITLAAAKVMGASTNVPLNINTGATLTPGVNLITLHGDFINDGTLTSGTGGVTIAGTTATQSIDGFTTTGTVSMTKTAGTATLQGNVNGAILTINGTGGTLNLGVGLTHTFTGNWTRTNGTLNGGSSTLKIGASVSGAGGAFTAGTGTVEWNAAGVQTLAAVTYNNLVLSGSGNKTFTAVTAISGNFTISGTAVANLGTGFTHTANTLTLGAAGQVSGSHGSTGSAATNKNDTYFLNTSNGIVNVSVCSGTSSGTATTYYSRNATSGGNWNDNTSWTTNADGTGGPLATGTWPRRFDNVVIRSGHTIIINAIDDNLACGVSPDGLANPNIGAGGGTGFNGSNIAMLYQTGDIAISGTLSVISGINMMVAGYTHLTSTGTFSLTSYLVNAGYLEADASSNLTTLDDLSLTGNSTTIINTSVTSADDLNIDHTNATLCGTGTSALLNSGGSAINYTNSATVAQICTSFTVTCSGGGCAGFPVVGTTSVILGNTGPGGIDKSDGTGSLEFWLDSYDVNGNGTNPANGATIVTWTDKSGNGVNVTRNVANAATYSTSPGVVFAGNGYLLGSDATFPAGGTARTAYVCASTPVSADDDNLFFYGNDAASQSYGIMKTATERVRNYFYGNDLDDTGGTAGWLPAGQTKVVNTRYASNFQEIFVDGTAFGTKAATPNTTIGADGVQVGGWSAFPATNSFATIKEVILHSKAINNAHRIIIDNYLAAKYNSTLASNDIYTMDIAGNGNYDYQMAAIGQASDGSNHKDAKGPGIVRMWNANGLGNSEFLLWGHDNATLISSTSTVGLAGVDGTVIEERLVRIWRLTESGGDVGTVSVSFDMSSFPSTSLGSNLRLLIDRDGDGFGDNDVTPVAGSFANNTVVFSGINFQSGDRFTLGNTDLSKPLPIQLIDFKAIAKSSSVELTWATAMEMNNDFFTVQKSSNPEKGFQDVGKLTGRGNSSVKQEYFLADQYPYSGLSYYRLKQTDFDGKFTYSKLVSVNYEGSSLASLIVYPNPLKDKQTLKVEMTGLKGMNEVPIVIYNSVGQKILEKTISVNQGGSVQEEFFFEKPLSAGVFIVKAGPTLQLTQRLVVE